MLENIVRRLKGRIVKPTQSDIDNVQRSLEPMGILDQYGKPILRESDGALITLRQEPAYSESGVLEALGVTSLEKDTVRDVEGGRLIMPTIQKIGAPIALAGMALGYLFAPALVRANQSSAEPYYVHGTVLDYANTPVPNALFAVENLSNGWRWHGTTQQNGNLDIIVDTAVGVREQQAITNSLNINSGGIHYNLVDNNGKLVVYNSLGQRVSEHDIAKGDGRLSLDKNLGSGVYFVVVNSDNYEAVSRLSLVDGSILGSRTDVKRNVVPFLAKPSQADAYVLKSLGLEGYEAFADTIDLGVDFDGYEDIARVNMIPSLKFPFPNPVDEGYNVREPFKNDDNGLIEISPPSLQIVGGKISYASKPASAETIPFTLTYRDSVNPSLMIVVESVLRYVPKDRFGGELRDNRTELTRPGVIIVDGQTYYTDASGYFSFQIVPADSHTVRARIHRNGEPFGFFATQRIAGNKDYEGMVVKAVSYDGLSPDPNGDPNYTPELSIALSDEANFQKDGNSGLVGLKAIDFERAKDYVFWIGRVNPVHSDTFSVAEQDYIEQTIINEIYPYISDESHRPRIYKASLDDVIPVKPGTLVPNEYGVLLIMPRRIGDPGSVGTYDHNKDGIIDNASIGLKWGDERNKIAVVQEPLSALVAPNPVWNSELFDLTVLHESGVPPNKAMTLFDKILLSIGEDIRYFKPLTPIYHVQGIE